MSIRLGCHIAAVAGALAACVSAADAAEMPDAVEQPIAVEATNPAAASSVADTLPAQPLLRANTEIHLKLLEPIASHTHKHGDRFALEVVEPVLVDGVTVIPSGAKAEGQVVHAAKGGFGGRAGELILATRFVRVGDREIKLRSFSAGSGEDRVNLALGLSFVVVGLFVTGKDISLPADTDVYAKIAADTPIPSTLAPGPAPVDGQPSLPASAAETDNETSQQ